MSDSPPLRTSSLAGAVTLAAYLLILDAASGLWLRLLLPNAVLLIGTLVVLRGRARTQLLPGPSRLGPGVALTTGGLLVAFCAWWPGGWRIVDPTVAGEAAVLALLVPLAEELFFRGMLLTALSERWGGALGSVLVSLLFAWLHLPQGSSIALAMLGLSLVLCALALITRTTLWAVALHMGWNAAALCMQLPPGPERWTLAGGVTAVLVALLGWGLASRRSLAR